MSNIDEVTFNGLDRPAMLFGAPIRPLGICFVVITMISLFLSFIYGLKSFIIIGAILPIFIALKFTCENDENALNVLKYSFKFFFLHRFNLDLNHSILRKVKLSKKDRIFKHLVFSPVCYGETGETNVIQK